MLKQIIILLTSIFLALISTVASATTLGAWTLSNPTAVGASILYDGSTGTVTSSTLITPNASQVAKALRVSAAGYALTLAVEQLLGTVDWILDPANNQIKYYVDPPDASNKQWAWKAYNPSNSTYSYFLTAQLACAARSSWGGYTLISVDAPVNNWATCRMKTSNWSNVTTQVNYNINTTYNPNTKPEEKTLSLDVVAQQVIENAQDNNLDAQFAILAATTDILAEAEQDDAKAQPIEDELERNADDDSCEKQILVDENICRSLPNQTQGQKEIRNRCWASANARYGACVANNPLPPLVTW